MWLAYEQSRGWADHAGFPLQVEMPRNVDRFLFFGTDPTVWLQHHFYDPHEIHWYDKVASATYFTHFIFPVIAIAVVWVTSHREWARFIKRFASLLFVACTMFVLMPTVPPWMAADRRHFDFRILPPLTRHTGRGFRDLGLKGFVNQWQSALDWGNAVAAMPSLHAAFALFVPAFFLPRIKPALAQGGRAGVPGDDAHVARVLRRALRDRRSRRLAHRRAVVPLLGMAREARCDGSRADRARASIALPEPA